MTAWTIYNPAGSSVHGIFQARVLEWIAIFSPGELPDPLLLHGQVGFFFFYHQANREYHEFMSTKTFFMRSQLIENIIKVELKI